MAAADVAVGSISTDKWWGEPSKEQVNLLLRLFFGGYAFCRRIEESSAFSTAWQ
jgi:hypothetical protein